MTVGRPRAQLPHPAEPSPRSISGAGSIACACAGAPAQPQKHLSASEARSYGLVPAPNPTSFCERKSELERPATDARRRALPAAQWEAKPLPSAVSLATFLSPTIAQAPAGLVNNRVYGKKSAACSLVRA